MPVTIITTNNTEFTNADQTLTDIDIDLKKH